MDAIRGDVTRNATPRINRKKDQLKPQKFFGKKKIVIVSYV